MNLPKNLYELDMLKKPIPGYTIFANKNAEMVVMRHFKQKSIKKE